MKREHKVISEQLPPFSSNLIFWAPLGKDDLTDHISGVTGYALNAPSGNLTWTDNVGAYRFYCTSRYQNALIFPVTNYKQRFGSSDDITYSVDIRKISSIVYHFTAGYAKNGDDNVYDYGYPMFHLNSYQSQVSTSQFDKFTWVVRYSDLSIKLYKNSTLIYNNSTPSDSIYFPRNYRTNWWDSLTLIGVLGGNYTTNAYFKDMRVYNRAFTASEVVEL